MKHQSINLTVLFDIVTDIIHEYNMSCRYYHTMDHVFAMFDKSILQHVKQKPHYVLAALYHDIVQLPFETDRNNIEHSIRKARYDLVYRLGYTEEDFAIIQRLIRMTDHNPFYAKPETMDEKLIKDADLAILGSKPKTFEQYEIDVRKEYLQHSDEKFRNGRIVLLNCFLLKKYIYSTSFFRKKYEKQARINIRASIARLSQNVSRSNLRPN
ncbi:MAG: hypothetical protein Q7R33_01695 [Nitrosarchaeum sp.]|nr:hypothetical protein [Nitrosarchaeum sp.]